jgi:hypothetical protein
VFEDEMGCECFDGIELAQDRGQCPAVNRKHCTNFIGVDASGYNTTSS